MTDKADERALRIANLRYALSCHNPAMKPRVHLHTGYGVMDLYGPQARSSGSAWNAQAGCNPSASRRGERSG